MDDRLEQLQAEFQETSRRTAELKVELDLAQGKVPREGVPHYILIEEAAHEVGQNGQSDGTGNPHGSTGGPAGERGSLSGVWFSL